MAPEDLFSAFFTQLSAVTALSGPLDFLFEPWKLVLGGRDVLSRASWSAAMDFFRIGLALVAAGLLLIEARARRLGEKIPARTAKRIGIAFAALAFFAYFDFFNPNVRYQHYYHRHELYHYYLGSKYFDEVGYTRLYECTAVAEAELGRAAKLKKRELRDLRVNLIKPISETYVFDDPAQCKRHFSPEKWAAFKEDIRWFEKNARGNYWENMVKDHGYNPPPVWTMTGKHFASLAPAGDGFFKLLSTLDVALHAGVVLMLYWAFGWRVMAVATVFWGCNAPANFYWTGGAFLRQDWLFLLVASMCLARKRRFGLSGAALTWSALLRVFPLILFAGWAIVVAIHLIRKRALHPDHKRLIGGCIVAAGLLIPTSMVVAGPDSYKEFVQHISVHKDTPLTNHMGLETILSHGWEGRMRFTQNNALDDPFQEWKDGRRERFGQMKPVFYLIVLSLFAWMVWALRRTKLLWAAMPLSLPLVISLTNLTCYYYSMFIIAAPLMKVRPGVAPALLVTSGASHILLRTFYYIDDRYTALSYLFYAMGLLLLYAYSRPFSMERLEAWWAGKPEPGAVTAPKPPAPAPAE